MPRQLLVESIRIDGETQSRERINEETVTEYAEAMKVATGKPWPALTVYFDGTEYWLADGFHRLLAALRNGRKNVTADVKQGSRADAAWASCAANQSHGLRRTNSDKLKAVKIALNLHPEKTDRVLAQHCGVSHPFVGELRRQLVTVTNWPRHLLVSARREALCEAKERRSSARAYAFVRIGGRERNGRYPVSTPTRPGRARA